MAMWHTHTRARVLPFFQNDSTMNSFNDGYSWIFSIDHGDKMPEIHWDRQYRIPGIHRDGQFQIFTYFTRIMMNPPMSKSSPKRMARGVLRESDHLLFNLLNSQEISQGYLMLSAVHPYKSTGMRYRRFGSHCSSLAGQTKLLGPNGWPLEPHN